jgi:pre-mRNA-processing factor 8
MKDIMDMMP